MFMQALHKAGPWYRDQVLTPKDLAYRQDSCRVHTADACRHLGMADDTQCTGTAPCIRIRLRSTTTSDAGDACWTRLRRQQTAEYKQNDLLRYCSCCRTGDAPGQSSCCPCKDVLLGSPTLDFSARQAKAYHKATFGRPSWVLPCRLERTIHCVLVRPVKHHSTPELASRRTACSRAGF